MENATWSSTGVGQAGQNHRSGTTSLGSEHLCKLIAVEYSGARFGCHFLEKRNVSLHSKVFFQTCQSAPSQKWEQKKHKRKHTVPVIGEGWTEPAVSYGKPSRKTPSWWWKAGEWHLHEVLEGEFGIEGWKDHRDEVKQTHLAGRDNGDGPSIRGGSVVLQRIAHQETTSTPTSWRTRAASGCWINFRNSLGRFGIISYESSDDSMSCSKFKFFRIRYRNNILGTSKNFGLQFDTRERSSNVCSPAAHWVRSLSRDLKCKTASIAFWCLYHLYL